MSVMSDKIKGLKKALAASREANRQSKIKNQQLSKIIKMSDMKGMETVLSLESNYFGGLYDRLGQVSRWLTAIAWDKYPNQSFEALKAEIKGFSSYISDLINQHGINFAIIAPNELNPCEDGMWQLVHNSPEFHRVREFDEDGFEVFPEEMTKVRVYLLEAFFDVPSSEANRLGKEILEFQEALEKAFDNFSVACLIEMQKDLDRLNLSLDKLQSVV